MSSAGTGIEVYRRDSDRREREVVMGERWLCWAYQSSRARWLHGLLFRSALPSRLLGWYFDSRFSRGRIPVAIAQLGIDPSEFRDPPDSFASFNAFFTRHLKPECRPVVPDPAALPSPADGRAFVCPDVADGTAFRVKGCDFTAADLLGRSAPEYSGGIAIIVRLAPPDYHRFHFPCAGRIVERGTIAGALHSVNPLSLALGFNVFAENQRCYTIHESPRFGRLAMVEVGAFGVGSIIWTFDGETVCRMQEKGFFKFGGSTIVLLFEPGKLAPAEDLLRHSRDGYETLIKAGQMLGTAVAATSP